MLELIAFALIQFATLTFTPEAGASAPTTVQTSSSEADHGTGGWTGVDGDHGTGGWTGIDGDHGTGGWTGK